MSIHDFHDKPFHPKIVNGCGSCMFNIVSCGTFSLCPGSAGGKLVIDGDKAHFADNHLCWCLKPSPIPCFMYCGVGPCAQVPKFKKESDTVYVGTGESQLDGGCCTPCCHNKGDKMEYNTTTGQLEWWAGPPLSMPSRRSPRLQ